MYDPVYELEHFGVPGMKWGVHRQEKKLNRYKERETSKINKRIAKIDKAQQKFDKNVKKTRVLDFEKAEMLFNSKETAAKELKAIRKMSYKDMQDERVELGKRLVEDLFTNMAAAGKTPPKQYDPSSIKTTMRLKQGRYAKKKPNINK